MYSFERLIREHQAISDRAAALTGTIAGGKPAIAQRQALSAVARALADHLASEDADIYPQLMLSADLAAATAAREAVIEFETLAADWQHYEGHWTASAIAADPQGFAAASHAILARLAARVRIENELLYPLALRAAHIRLRD